MEVSYLVLQAVIGSDFRLRSTRRSSTRCAQTPTSRTLTSSEDRRSASAVRVGAIRMSSMRWATWTAVSLFCPATEEQSAHNFLVRDAINTLVVMHYPTDNCPADDGSRPPLEEQYAETRRLFASFSNVRSRPFPSRSLLISLHRHSIMDQCHQFASPACIPRWWPSRSARACHSFCWRPILLRVTVSLD